MKKSVRFLTIVFGLLAFSLLATSFAYAAVSVRSSASDSAPVATAKCELENCWKVAFPEVNTLVSGATSAIQAYAEGLNQKLSDAEKFDPSDPDYQQKSLDLQLAYLKQYLDECESLKDGPGEQRQIVIMGNTLDHNNVVVSAETAYSDALVKTCGQRETTAVYKKCARSIVLLKDENKQDLFNFLRLLGTGSVGSITYAGHGGPVSLLLGMKNLLLPMDWYPGQKITAAQWRKLNAGGLYTQDFDGAFGAELARVAKRGAPVSIYACRAAGPFSEELKELLPTSTVKASVSPMHFEYSMNPNADPNNPADWITDWENDVPANAKSARLVSDETGSFGPVKAPPGGVHLAEVGSPNSEPGMSAEDRAARIILFRLGAGSGDSAMVDQGKTMVVFDESDRDEIRKIFGSVIGHDYLTDNNLKLPAILDEFENARKSAATPAEAQQIERIEGWYKKSIDEAVRLYY